MTPASKSVPSLPLIAPSTLLALVAIQITFASNYLFSKVVMESIPPLLWGALRTFITATLLLFVLLFRKELNPKAALQSKKQLFYLSLLGVILNQAAFLEGLNLTTTANCGLINTMIPVFTLIWVTISGQEKLTRIRWVGFFLALIGVFGLQDFKHLSFAKGTHLGDALTLLNALFYSFFLFLSPSFAKNHKPLWVTTWLFLVGSLGLGLLSIPTWQQFDLSLINSRLLLFGGLGVFFGNLIPYVLISVVLQRASSSIIAQFVYLQAVIAGLLGYWFLEETLTERTFLGATLIFLGLYLSLSRTPFGIRLSKRKGFTS